MLEEAFNSVNPIVVCLGLMGVLIGASGIGFWVKKRSANGGGDGIVKSDLALILGAVLTMLALMLGFSYAMAAGRFDIRRQLVVDEANALGTAYLRAGTLAEPRCSDIRELLRGYAAERAAIARMADVTPEQIVELDVRFKRLHGLLWAHAEALARETPSPIAALFIQSLNELIDLHSKRLAAFRNRVPFPIFMVLFVASAVTLWLAGYYLGFSEKRLRSLTTVFSFLVATVMWLIMDLDQPGRGAIRTGHQSLLDLHQDLGPAAPGSAEFPRPP